MKAYIYTIFIFVLLILSIIIYYIRSETVNNFKITYNEFYRSNAINTVIEFVDQKTIQNIIKTSTIYSLFDLTHRRTPVGNTVDDVKREIRNLVENHNTFGFNQWVQKLKNTSSEKGVLLNIILKNYNINQIYYTILEVYYEVYYEVYDIYNKTGKNGTIEGNFTIDITGFPDPLAIRLLYNYNGSVNAIVVNSNPSIRELYSSGFGQGWAYGTFNGSNDPHILVATISEAVSNQNNYDAFIITDVNYSTIKTCNHSQANDFIGYIPPDHSEFGIPNAIKRTEYCVRWDCIEINSTLYCYCVQYECITTIENPLSKPWIAGNNLSGINELGEGAVLFITNGTLDDPTTKTRGGYVYDIEDLRDFVNCGYYFMLRNHAPSYLARFTSSLPKDQYGIDILLIEDEYNSSGSSLASEWGSQGKIIRGLAGCKLENNCTRPTRISESIARILGFYEILK
jgi:hypothetical protein